MNIYNTSHIGKMPLWLDDFRFIIDMFKPFMEQLAKAVAKTENMVLTGCTETISGGLSTVTAGYTLIAGELCYFRGGTIAIAPNEFAIFTINQTINHDGDRTFGDGTVHEDIYIIREAQLEKVDDHEQPEGYCSVSANGLSLFRQIYEPKFAKKTAFNKDFGTEVGQILPIGTHGVGDGILIYEGQDDGVNSVPVKTGFNKNFGVVAGTVAEGNHNHVGVYKPNFTENTAFNKDFGTVAGTVAEGGHQHDYTTAGAWQIATLNAGWDGYLSYRIHNRMLQFEGYVEASSGTSDVIFTLPINYRPILDRVRHIVQVVMSSSEMTVIIVRTNGDVTISHEINASTTLYMNFEIPLT